MTFARGLGTISIYVTMGPNNSMQRILLLGKQVLDFLNEASQRVNLPLVLEKLTSLSKTSLSTASKEPTAIGRTIPFSSVSLLHVQSLLAIEVLVALSKQQCSRDNMDH